MDKENKPIIVISAINIYTGGPLSILNDCLRSIQLDHSERFEIVALVHKRELIKTNGIKCIEFPLSRKAYLFRLYYEFIFFKRLSLKLKPYLWLSLHDITPNVIAERRAVYCHNSTPFYKATLKDLYFEPSTFMFSLFYRFLYRINIKKNNTIVVQQNWMRDKFKSFFNISNVISVHPDIILRTSEENINDTTNLITFFYPSLPRVFKNFEVIGEAVRIMKERGVHNFNVIFTIDGSENRYAKHLVRKFSHLNEIKFIGFQQREEIFNLYNKIHCLLFPSKLESWGLPLSEFKILNKPIIAADLPYAKETLGDFVKVCYFNPDSAVELANSMTDFINQKIKYSTVEKIQLPDAIGWSELSEILINSKV